MKAVPWLLVAVGCFTSAEGWAGQRVSPKEAALADVAAGKLTEVNAAWWGFDPEDATAALQAALDSGAKRVVVPNLGQPWVVTPLQLRSDQEVLFEEGVEVLAKRGAFKATNDCLFSCANQRNVTLRGPGATFRMRKADYHTAAYKPAEWRHCLSIRSSTNVTVVGLTLADSGGDGIYLGTATAGVTNRHLRIRDVVCDGNNRQGISVITAEDLLIENTVMRNTSGTPPMAGIDFEPNRATERLVNCVMRNCLTENNAGDGYQFYLKHLLHNSAPLSMRFENCRSVGDRSSLRFGTGNAAPDTCVGGLVEFVDCSFESGREGGVVLNDKPASGCRLRFIDCRVLDALVDKPDRAPVMLNSRAGNTESLGGIEFRNCVVRDALDRRPLGYTDAGGLRVLDITGRLTVEHGGQRTVHDLTQDLLDKWMPFQVYRKFPPLASAGVKYVPFTSKAETAALRECPCRQRDHAEHLLWAEADDAPQFTVRVLPVGKRAVKPVPVSVVTPSGETLRQSDAEPGAPARYTFDAKTTGAYRIVCEPGGHTVRVGSTTHRLCATWGGALLHLLGTTGRYYFWVPPDVRAFGIRVMGSGDERVTVALLSPAGKRVAGEDNVSACRQFVGDRTSTEGEVWSIQFDRPTEGVLEDFYVKFEGLPPVLAYAEPVLLKPAR